MTNRITGETGPGARLELHRRLKAIVSSGALAGLRPSALVVLVYALAHADFGKATVYLGARTIAARVGMSRGSIRRGIADLLEAGLLDRTTANTFTKAAVYVIGDRVQGCTLSGSKAVPREGAGVDPEGVQGCTPNPASHASPERSMRGDRRSADADGDAATGKRLERLRSAQIKPRHVAGARIENEKREG
jgi:hypothetical protein